MKKILPGEWRKRAQERIRDLRIDVAEAGTLQGEIEEVLQHTCAKSEESAVLRNMRCTVIVQRNIAEARLRQWRKLLKLTRVCPKCRGRFQKYDKRRKSFQPCPACRAQGALWVR